MICKQIYPLLDWAEVIFLASRFFSMVTAQAKALIDRSQAHWSRRLLEKNTGRAAASQPGQGLPHYGWSNQRQEPFRRRYSDRKILL